MRGFPRVVAALLVFAWFTDCGPVAKKKSDDPTSLVEDIDGPLELVVSGGALFWISKPIGYTGMTTGPGSVWTMPTSGGDPVKLVKQTKDPVGLALVGSQLYWFQFDGTHFDLMRCELDGSNVTTIAQTPAEQPSLETRLVAHDGTLFWAGAEGVYAMPLDGGPIEQRVDVATPTFLALISVDSSGLYWSQVNNSLSRDLIHTPLSGAPKLARTDGGSQDAGATDAGSFDAGSFDAGSFDAGSFDAGIKDGGVFDAGASDAGSSDGGSMDGGMPMAGTTTEDGRIYLLRGTLVAGGTGFAEDSRYGYFFTLSIIAQGSTLLRVPVNGGSYERVLDTPATGAPDHLVLGGTGLYWGDGSTLGAGIYGLDLLDGGVPRQLYQGGLLTFGIPRLLRLDDQNVYFVSGATNSARIQKVAR